MRYLKHISEQAELFNARGSEVRMQILNQLQAKGRMSMNELADKLGLSQGALTPHIRKLESADLVRINQDAMAHGNMKMCEPHLDKIFLVFSQETSRQNEYASHIRVGQYSSCEIYPTCGISTEKSIIGEVDDPRYFTHQKRFEADILWFTRGFVEYMVPCIIPRSSRITEFSVSVELSSEAPGVNANWPSDIYFSLNGMLLGQWTSPGDYGDVPGRFTPDWWLSNWNQYGLLKTLTVNEKGTFMDDVQISQAAIQDLNISSRTPIYFRFSVPDSAEHVGGLTLFGRGFGNYNQDIEFHIQYERE